MMTRKITCGIAAAALLAGIFSSTAAYAGEAETDKLNVKVWDSKQQAGIQTICDEWSAQSGVKVSVEVVDWDNYWTLLEAGAFGGEMPDVFWMHSNYAQKYMENDLLLKLDDYIANDEAIDLGNYYEDIVKLYQTADGATYAVPKDYDTIALWYNKTLFDAAGLDYPDNTWTWEKLHEAGAALNKPEEDQYGMVGNTDANQEGYYNAIYSYGGYVISDDHKKSGYDDPKTLEAMEMYAQLIKDCMAPQNTMAETGNANLFLSGTAAMGMFGSWYVSSFVEMPDAVNWGIAELPFHDANGNGQADEGERVSIYNGLGWAASAATKDPDTAYSLISYLCSEEGQTRQAELGITMSAYNGTSEAWKNSTDVVDLSAYLDEANGDATLVIMPYSRSTIWAEDAKQAFVEAWQDTSKMESVCRSIAESMNQQLAEE